MHGRHEPGFPKIRNPKLVGVACKHSLRVMIAIQKDVSVREKVAAMVATAQRNSAKALVTTAAAARAEAQQQLAQSHHLKNRVETSTQQAKRPAAAPAARARALMAATQEAERRAQAEIARSRKELEAAFARLNSIPLSKAQRDALVAHLMASKTTD